MRLVSEASIREKSEDLSVRNVSASILQLQRVAMLVYGPALLIGLTTRQLARIVADGACGKTWIEGLIEFVHQSKALVAVGLASQFARDIAPGTGRVLCFLGHCPLKLRRGEGARKRQNTPFGGFYGSTIQPSNSRPYTEADGQFVAAPQCS
jgi:hypothetical protein